MSYRASAFVGVAAVLAGASPVAAAMAAAAPELFSAQPSYDVESGQLALLVGASHADGSPAKPTALRLLVGGAEAAEPLALAPLPIDNAKWEPPFAIGVVYLWATGSPQQVLDGVEALCKHLPASTRVYPTPYGQGYRGVITRLTAARAAGGDLSETPPLEGNQYRLLDAVRFNARKLAEDEALIKYLIIVTDGRDPRAVDDPGLASAVGRELLQAGLRVAIVGSPASEDIDAAHRNLSELAAAAHARMLAADHANDLLPLVEAQAETLLDWSSARFAIPWRMRGGWRAIAVRGFVDGRQIQSPELRIEIPGGAPWGLIGVFGFLLAGAAGAGFWLLRRRTAGATPEPLLLDELEEIIRLGLPAVRAVEELSLVFPDSVHELLELDLRNLPTRYGFLRTRAGQSRLAEIQHLLATNAGEATLDEEMAEILAQGIARKQAAPKTAEHLQALVAGARWAALARASRDDLEESLRAASEDFAELGSPAAVAYVQGVQAALREPSAHPLAAPAVGWFVRAAGPGQRGQTFQLVAPSCLVGRGVGCQLRLSDESVAEEHAEMVCEGSEFVLVPRQGSVKVEGTELPSARPLIDGETVEIGNQRFIFKCVT
jgi:hypothetical protein